MTNAVKGAVLITRPKEDAEILSHLLNEINIPHMIASMVEVKQEAISAPLRASLKQGLLQGVILTSRHGAACLNTVELPKTLAVYAVGDATAKAATDAGFLNVVPANNTAENLFEYIALHCDPAKGAFFYPHGYDIAFDMEQALTAKGFSVISASTYVAEKIEALSPHLIHSITSGEISHVTLFSKRTAQSYQDRILKYGLGDAHKNMTVLCIRDTVADAVSALPWKEVKSASTPSFEAMLELIRNNY